MPIRFTLHGDEVRCRYEGKRKHFLEYKTFIKSWDFVRWDGAALSWVFPVHMFKRMINALSTLPDTPYIDPKLQDRLVEDKVSAAKASEIREQIESVFDPEGFKAKLLSFQTTGALFLVEGRRCVIGDDVGLGKTVQTVAAMGHLFEKGEIDSALIIVPGHLKRQWAGEIEKFTYLQPTIIEGSRNIREWKINNATEILIINYELLPRDPEYLSRDWGLVILDEGQEIKNYRTQSAKLCRKLRSSYKWVLTATVLENSLPELHSIFSFVAPGLLGPWWEFERRFIKRNLFGGIKGYRNLDQLKDIIRPYLLRRRVEDCISDFPEKESKIVPLNFFPEEGTIYEDVNKQVLDAVTEKMERINHSQRMVQIGYLRQACDSSFLIDPELDYPSVKVEWLKETIDEIRQRGEKAVIFTEWARMVKRLHSVLGDCPMMHGQMNFSARHATIENWKKSDDPLVVTDCANVGLNLQDANWLINFEMHWNPAVMKQRVGRVYRLTQERKVRVRAPMIKGTVEDKVLEALCGKVDLFKKVIDALASKAKKVSRHDRKPVS